ncbi:T7SS effector LXG polymorphic toxin [Sporolactobacillus putidus]|uniref:LXG domain-containing protein n=1 Tax=Sporolactobacillus putidus TaxID=492735 RepID=A0A917W1R1_9BACL|nr:T7SS effector LXG polymorphic toxin [Sporolactobacillus putidus]GGL51901.1 hypothetical protein GCM10007968_15060 [Sporolactobacillus putidus]
MPKVQIAEPRRIESQLAPQEAAAADALRKIQTEIKEFNALQSFEGAAADSIRAYFSEVHLTLIKSLIQAGERLQQVYKKMLQQFDRQVDSDSNAVIRSEHLDDVRRQLRQLKSHFDGIENQLAADVRAVSDVSFFNVPSAMAFSSDVELQDRETGQLKDQFMSFVSADFTGDLVPLLTAIERAMTKIKKDYSPHLGTESFYVGGTFAQTAIGKELIQRTKAVETAYAGDVPKTGQNGNLVLVKNGAKYTITLSALTAKTLPAGLAAMKGLKIVRRGNYIYITGDKKWMELYLGRWGKLPQNYTFNMKLTNGDPIRIGGEKGPSIAGYGLINESSDVKNYLLSESGTMGKLKAFNGAVKSSLNSNWDFVKKGSWTKLGSMGKFGKAAGIAGVGLTVYSDIEAHKNEKMGGEKVANITEDIGVDLGVSAAATGVGAIIGSFFFPPLGTVVGAVAGAEASTLLNYKFKAFGNKSIVDSAKSIVHNAGNQVASWVR